MAGSQDLEVFVRDALSRGVPRERVAITLADAGWSTAQVQRALGSWAEVDFPVPVPRPRASLSAREAFFYLLMFAALYMAAFHLCDLMFDVLFESPLGEYEEIYHEYFYAHCDQIVASSSTLALPADMLAGMKHRVSEWRKALLALTQSQSGTWRRPKF